MNTYLKERNIFVVIIVTLLTFGLYGLFVWVVFGAELKAEAEWQKTEVQLGSPVVAFLLGLCTFGIYMIYYTYKQAQVLQELGGQVRVQVLDPVIVCMLTIFVGIGNLINIYHGTVIAQAVNQQS